MQVFLKLKQLSNNFGGNVNSTVRLLLHVFTTRLGIFTPESARNAVFSLNSHHYYHFN